MYFYFIVFLFLFQVMKSVFVLREDAVSTVPGQFSGMTKSKNNMGE